MVSSPFLSRQLVASMLALPVLLLTGCLAPRFPTTTGVWEEDKQLIKTLNGASITDVRSQLGEESDTFQLPDVTYLFYKRVGTRTHAVFWVFPPPSAWPSGHDKNRLYQCLLVESRNDTVVHAEIKSHSESLLIGASTFRGCPSLFWENEELKRIRNAANQRFFCPKIYYRADDSFGPQASDKFIHVCEGDDLYTEETVLISADWDKTYTTPPRRYFKTVPNGLR